MFRHSHGIWKQQHNQGQARHIPPISHQSKGTGCRHCGGHSAVGHSHNIQHRVTAALHRQYAYNPLARQSRFCPTASQQTFPFPPRSALQRAKDKHSSKADPCGTSMGRERLRTAVISLQNPEGVSTLQLSHFPPPTCFKIPSFKEQS